MGDPALHAGADRFHGYADLYDEVRPSPPDELVRVLSDYAQRRFGRVVDLGSGTGLSSRWAATWAGEVIAVEPSNDMRRVAEGRAIPNVSSVRGWSHDTGLADATADAVIAVQALHWMEPDPTFREIARILRPAGVFAAIDCDWPPIVGDHVVERAWDECRRRMRVLEARLADGLSGAALRAAVDPSDEDGARYSGIDAHRDRRLADGVRSWSKSGHLDRMHASGRFTWCREVALVSHERGDADRFVALLESQGDYQTLRRSGLDDDDLGFRKFARLVRERLGDEPRPWRFVYRARIGVVP